MDHHQTRSTYCILVNKSDNLKYLCYFTTNAGLFNLGVTDASQVWSTGYTEETLAEHMKKFALKSTEGYVSKVRVACNSGHASLVLGEDSAVLQLGDAPGSMSVSLMQLGDTQCQAELRDVIFRMAESLTHLESAAASMSPVKTQQRAITEFEPRRQQTGPVLAVRKRVPGDSLINPGTRRKKAATGVAFDDNADM